jgi:hypothetical protein
MAELWYIERTSTLISLDRLPNLNSVYKSWCGTRCKRKALAHNPWCSDHVSFTRLWTSFPAAVGVFCCQPNQQSSLEIRPWLIFSPPPGTPKYQWQDVAEVQWSHLNRPDWGCHTNTSRKKMNVVGELYLRLLTELRDMIGKLDAREFVNMGSSSSIQMLCPGMNLCSQF